MKAKKKLIAKRPKVTRAEREHARRFAANVSTGLLVVGAIAGLVMAANKWARKEELHGIRIVGRNILDSAEVMRQAAAPDSIPFAKLDLAAIESRVESHPFISHAAVYRGENGTLVVEIAERAPAAVTVINGSPVYMDSLGIALYLGDLAEKVFKDSLLFPFALSLIGIAIIALGLYYHRHQDAARAWVDANLPDFLQRLRPANA